MPRTITRRRRPNRVVIDFDRGQRAPRHEHPSGLTQHCARVGHMLEKPHHPDMVEGAVREGELGCIGTAKVGTHTQTGEVGTSYLQLALLDVHSCQHNAGKRLTEDRQHRPHPTTDLQQPRPGSQPRPREDQLLPPVFGLQQQALLLVARIAVNVTVSHARK